MPQPDTRIYDIALCSVTKVGPHLARQLIAYCGSSEAVFQEKPGKLLKIPGVGRHIVNNIQKSEALTIAENELNKLIQANASVVFYTDPHYPSRLKDIFDAPLLLYYKGNIDFNAQKTISIVGTRNATDYGKEVTVALVRSLTAYQPVIISGLAYGIDAAAHKSAVDNQLATVGVMATGIDTIYPSVHRSMADRMIENGGIVTEYRIDSKPEPQKFPARNRIIAALSDVTIVVEAAEKGGALITAEMALSYNREVMAVPGSLQNRYSMGCNNLIKSHKAQMITDPNDIPLFLQWTTDTKPKNTLQKQPPEQLSEEEKKIFQCLSESNVLMIDELSWKSQLPINKVTSVLLNMELLGIVKPVPGKKYKLV